MFAHLRQELPPGSHAAPTACAPSAIATSPCFYDRVTSRVELFRCDRPEARRDSRVAVQATADLELARVQLDVGENLFRTVLTEPNHELGGFERWRRHLGAILSLCGRKNPGATCRLVAGVTLG